MRATFKFRVERQGKRKVIEIRRPPRRRAEPPAIHPVARRLALAYHVERCVEAGLVADYAAAARLLEITRARMSQILDLRLLPVDAQEQILQGELRPSKKDIAELLSLLCAE